MNGQIYFTLYQLTLLIYYNNIITFKIRANMNFQIQIDYKNKQNDVQQLINMTSSQFQGFLDQQSLNLKTKEKSSGKKNIKKRTYQWKLTQNRRYVKFLSINAALFNLSYLQKRKLKINVMMERFIKTRDCKQCHSHHQKMMQKYGTIQNIIKNILAQHSPKNNIDNRNVKQNDIVVQQKQASEFVMPDNQQKYKYMLYEQDKLWHQFLEPFMFVKQIFTK